MKEEKYEVRFMVGQQLADLRHQAGMSPEELAEKSGFKPATILNAEAGRFNMNLNFLGAVCEALGARIQIVKI